MTLTHPSVVSLSCYSSSSQNPTNFNFPNSKLCTSFPFSFSRPSLPFLSLSLCRCDSIFHDYSMSVEDDQWDWDRWSHHFLEIDEQEGILSVLKSRLGVAVRFEDYEDAATLKVAIAAVAINDTVGKAISLLNRAIEEERYSDAAILRDTAGTGLVGWWAGMSKDDINPHGLIIRITPEHGRYVARSYSPWDLAASAAGVPLFEIFLTKNKKGEFKLQVVYLNQRGDFYPPTTSSKALDASERLRSVESPEDRSKLFGGNAEDPKGVDDKNDSSDLSEEMRGFQNVSKDMIPSIKMMILKATTPEKVDKEEEGEDTDKNNETESPELEDIKSETDDEMELNSNLETSGHKEQDKIAVKVDVSSRVQKLYSSLITKDLLRVPAKLEMIGQGSFSFTVEKEVNEQVGHGKKKTSLDKSTKIQGQRSLDHMFDLAEFIGKGKVAAKILKDVGELISLRLSQSRDWNHEELSGSTIFNRIEIPTSPDPLNGLYIGINGLYYSGVIQLRCRYGHWQEDGQAKEPSDLEFFEYVEAMKLIGDPYVPAGQVVFRAKLGKSYQLPRKGKIPEEFGLIARYKGQGRLAELGFQNPRWVDGELVILDGKRMKAGLVVGFVYWAPEFKFLVLFNRLRLQQ